MRGKTILAIALFICSVFAYVVVFVASAVAGGMVHPAKDPLPVGMLVAKRCAIVNQHGRIEGDQRKPERGGR